MDAQPDDPAGDEVLAALDELSDALRATTVLDERILRRAEIIRRLRREGLHYSELVTIEDRPLIVELLREKQDRLTSAGARFRRAEARALRAEGMTLDRIALLFGVTRPRVIALLRAPDAED